MSATRGVIMPACSKCGTELDARGVQPGTWLACPSCGQPVEVRSRPFERSTAPTPDEPASRAWVDDPRLGAAPDAEEKSRYAWMPPAPPVVPGPGPEGSPAGWAASPARSNPGGAPSWGMTPEMIADRLASRPHRSPRSGLAALAGLGIRANGHLGSALLAAFAAAMQVVVIEGTGTILLPGPRFAIIVGSLFIGLFVARVSWGQGYRASRRDLTKGA